MELILVRHGITQGNLERRFIGVTDQPLCPEGAALACQRSLELPQVDRVYCSPLMRCQQTALLLWPWAERTVISELRETDFGPFEGKNHEELKDDPLYQDWLAYPMDPSAVPGVEHAVECGLRASKALEQLVADAKRHHYKRIGVVSHGGTMMGILARHGRPVKSYYNWYMDNCSGYKVELDDTSLLLWNRGTI